MHSIADADAFFVIAEAQKCTFTLYIGGPKKMNLPQIIINIRREAK